MDRYTFTEPCGCGMHADAADVAHALAALMASIKEPLDGIYPYNRPDKRNRPYFEGKLGDAAGNRLGDVIFRLHDGGVAYRRGYSLWWLNLVQHSDSKRSWEIILPNRRMRKAIGRAVGGQHPEAHDCASCVAAGYALAAIPTFPPDVMASSAAAMAKVIDLVSLRTVLERDLAGVCQVCGGPTGPLGSLCEEHLEWLLGEHRHG